MKDSLDLSYVYVGRQKSEKNASKTVLLQRKRALLRGISQLYITLHYTTLLSHTSCQAYFWTLLAITKIDGGDQQILLMPQ